MELQRTLWSIPVEFHIETLWSFICQFSMDISMDFSTRALYVQFNLLTEAANVLHITHHVSIKGCLARILRSHLCIENINNKYTFKLNLRDAQKKNYVLSNRKLSSTLTLEYAKNFSCCMTWNLLHNIWSFSCCMTWNFYVRRVLTKKFDVVYSTKVSCYTTWNLFTRNFIGIPVYLKLSTHNFLQWMCGIMTVVLKRRQIYL
jgi:hypothetical protein